MLARLAHARHEPSPGKINFHVLLECQNGSDCGPRSIKSRKQQIRVPTTNFGMLLPEQAETNRDSCGQVYKGIEGRSLFFLREQPGLYDQPISADLICLPEGHCAQRCQNIGFHVEML